MKTVRTLVVDDELPARERLRRLLADDPRLDLVACCASGKDAVEAVRVAALTSAPVQLMFLDIQMPELNGFGVLSTLVADAPSFAMPEIVFVTAHDEFAMRAFEAHATGYLLKPFSDERFQSVLDRAVRSVRGAQADSMVSRIESLLALAARAPGAEPEAIDPVRNPIDRFVIRGAGRVRLVPVDQIRWVEAEGVYVKIHTRDGAHHLHRALLGEVEVLLNGRQFIRIHRSAIVNIDMLAELRQDAHGDYVAVLLDRTELRVGRRFRDRLQRRLGQPL
jgi:two-component system LytT family response regulator